MRSQQAGQQAALKLTEIHRLERLVRRVRRAATGGVAARSLGDGRYHPHQPVVEFADVRVVGEQIEQHLPHGVSVLRVQLRTEVEFSSPSSSRRPASKSQRNPEETATPHAAGLLDLLTDNPEHRRTLVG